MAEAAAVDSVHSESIVLGARLAVCGALRSASPPTLRTGRARGISPQLPRPRARRFSHLGSRELRLKGELPSQYTPPPNWVFAGTVRRLLLVVSDPSSHRHNGYEPGPPPVM